MNGVPVMFTVKRAPAQWSLSETAEVVNKLIVAAVRLGVARGCRVTTDAGLDFTWMLA